MGSPWARYDLFLRGTLWFSCSYATLDPSEVAPMAPLLMLPPTCQQVWAGGRPYRIVRPFWKCGSRSIISSTWRGEWEALIHCKSKVILMNSLSCAGMSKLFLSFNVRPNLATWAIRAGWRKYVVCGKGKIAKNWKLSDVSAPSFFGIRKYAQQNPSSCVTWLTAYFLRTFDTSWQRARDFFRVILTLWKGGGLLPESEFVSDVLLKLWQHLMVVACQPAAMWSLVNSKMLYWWNTVWWWDRGHSSYSCNQETVIITCHSGAGSDNLPISNLNSSKQADLGARSLQRMLLSLNKNKYLFNQGQAAKTLPLPNVSSIIVQV